MERLQKLIAAAGLCSRRAAEEWIRRGRVSLNGQMAAIGDTADPSIDRILIDGKPLPRPQHLTYLLLNKPVGYMTTVADRHAEHTVMDLLPEGAQRVFPVGRLDKDTMGLLLLTNDGELAFRLTHPSYGIEKVYRVQVKGSPRESDLRQLRTGIQLEDGPASVVRVDLREKSTLEMVLHEGRKRQVRRMLEALGYPILRLERIRYGSLELGSLKRGACRPLTPGEVNALKRAAGLRSSSSREKTSGGE